MVAELRTRVIKDQISSLSTFAAQHKRQEMANNAPAKKTNDNKVDRSIRARMLHRFLRTRDDDDPAHAAVEEVDPDHEFLESLGWSDDGDAGEERWLDSWEKPGYLQTWLKTSLRNWRKSWVDAGKPAKQQASSDEAVVADATPAEGTEQEQQQQQQQQRDVAAANIAEEGEDARARASVPVGAGVAVAVAGSGATADLASATHAEIDQHTPQMPTAAIPIPIPIGNTAAVPHPAPAAPVPAAPSEHPALAAPSETIRQPGPSTNVPAPTWMQPVAATHASTVPSQASATVPPMPIPGENTTSARPNPLAIPHMIHQPPPAATFPPAWSLQTSGGPSTSNTIVTDGVRTPPAHVQQMEPRLQFPAPTTRERLRHQRPIINLPGASSHGYRAPESQSGNGRNATWNFRTDHRPHQVGFAGSGSGSGSEPPSSARHIPAGPSLVPDSNSNHHRDRVGRARDADDDRPRAESGHEQTQAQAQAIPPALAGAERQRFFEWYKYVYRPSKK